MKVLSIFWLALVIIISGCGSSSDEQPDSEVVGSWVSGCVVIGDRMGITTITFTSTEYTVVNSLYGSSTCISQTGIGKGSTTYRLGNSFTTTSGNEAYEFDRDVYFEGEFIFTRKSIVSVINEQLFFALPIPKDDCDPNEILNLEAPFGDVCNQRPVELDFDRPFSKKI